jgi:hypothetical protein
MEERIMEANANTFASAPRLRIQFCQKPFQRDKASELLFLRSRHRRQGQLLFRILLDKLGYLPYVLPVRFPGSFPYYRQFPGLRTYTVDPVCRFRYRVRTKA